MSYFRKLKSTLILSATVVAALISRQDSPAYVAADAQTMITAFNNAFYFTASGNRGYFRNTTSGGTTWFWGIVLPTELSAQFFRSQWP